MCTNLKVRCFCNTVLIFCVIPLFGSEEIFRIKEMQTSENLSLEGVLSRIASPNHPPFPHPNLPIEQFIQVHPHKLGITIMGCSEIDQASWQIKKVSNLTLYIKHVSLTPSFQCNYRKRAIN